jgi:hypothetical protein
MVKVFPCLCRQNDVSWWSHKVSMFIVFRVEFHFENSMDFLKNSFLGKTSKRVRKTQLSPLTTETLLAVMTLTPPLTAS